jgi:TadE-like protein
MLMILGKSSESFSYRGATIIEFVMFFPVFLAGLFILIWLGVAMNARGALSAAVDNGVRLAATRGNGNLYGKLDDPNSPTRRVGAMPSFDNWVFDSRNGAGGSTPQSRVGLIVSGESSIDRYNTASAHIFPGDGAGGGALTLATLPPHYTYAIAYIVQAMRMSIGESLRYPCDPRNEDGTDPQNGENCLYCRPVHPTTFDNQVFNPSTIGASSLLSRRFAIRCDFKPAPYLLRPILKLLSMLTGQEASSNDVGVISRYGYFDLNAYCSFQGGTADGSIPPRYCCKDPLEPVFKCR